MRKHLVVSLCPRFPSCFRHFSSFHLQSALFIIVWRSACLPNRHEFATVWLPVRGFIRAELAAATFHPFLIAFFSNLSLQRSCASGLSKYLCTPLHYRALWFIVRVFFSLATYSHFYCQFHASHSKCQSFAAQVRDYRGWISSPATFSALSSVPRSPLLELWLLANRYTNLTFSLLPAFCALYSIRSPHAVPPCFCCLINYLNAY